MSRFLKQIRRRYIKPWAQPLKPYVRHLRPWHQVHFAGIDVHYKMYLEGGGRSFGQGYIPFFQALRMPRQKRIFEWCAGPGFIGFSLLAHGLCETLCLADINIDPVDACRRTVRDNGLEDRVSVYHSDNLRSIPPQEQWDVVVSNPPHFADHYIGDIRGHDPDWRVHREFFATVAAHLKPGGIIVLQEQNEGSTPEMFRAMIEESGLAIVFVYGAEPQRTPHPRLYFLGIMRKGDTPPDWVAAASA